MRKNSIAMVLYEVLCLFVPLIITPYISRVLGADGIGIYSYTYSIAIYFVIIVQLGIKLYGRREIAKVNDNKEKYSKVFFELFYIELAMFAIVSVLYIGFILLFVQSNVYRIALSIQYIEIIVALLDISWLYFGLEKFTAIVIRNAIVRVGEIFLIFLFIHSKKDAFGYIVIMSGCNLLGVMSMWAGIRAKLARVKLEKKDIKRQMFPMLKFFIPVLSTTLFSVVDKTIIGAVINAENVGYYENAYKITKIPVVVVTALGNVALPRVTKLIADGKEHEGRQYIEKSMSLIMGVTVAMAFGMCGVANIFIPLYLGLGFIAAIPLFQVLSFMIVFIGWGNVIRTQYMLPKGYDMLYTKSVVYAAVINIIVSIILVMPFGALGVAVASLGSEVTVCVYSTIKLRRELDIGALLGGSIMYLLAGVIMVIGVVFVGKVVNTILPEYLVLGIQIVFGCIIYSAVIIIIELVTKRYIFIDEIKKMGAKLKRRY